MHNLARDVRQLETQLAACTQCGMCQAVCPLFKQTGKEADVSRGKIALLNGLVQEMFTDAKGVNDRLHNCLLCGSCAHNCPSNVNILQIFLKARGIITQYLGLPFVKKIMFRKILANPETFNTLMKIAAPFAPLLFKKQSNTQGTSCARIASPLLRHRQIIPLNKNPFNASFEDVNLDYRMDGKGVKVAFFVGCLIDKTFPDIAHSVVDVLRYFKTQIFIPENQGCCGIPAAAAGDLKTFETLVRLNVALFEAQQADYIVTACATCTSTIVHLWPALVDPADTAFLDRVKALAAKTVDISWLLEHRLNISGAVLPSRPELEKVTYHDPCHLKKSLGVSIEPRKVIQAAGHALIEMVDSDACCGMGGSFNLDHYDLSSAIGQQKARNIIQTGCPIVATSCPACMMQISDILAQSGQNIVVKHPVELYACSLEGKKNV
ncbi:MAG: (Fe-S)-binding protein [Proteobacteria bacterium]|nr:(Fe-S)-binding protein [Pseudomonadota bacterium]MBU1388219.1 (Fe-S)-binding protein [Pseudomonadota bacterium]MBU1543031.1 (Fe-S)-binding protein [Pseudomonadota bacterium]MBU2481603.1 (Fe-S)-binding protein [Pseudomonadota bacterium]